MKYILVFFLLLGQTATAQWVKKGQVMVEIGALPPVAVNLKTGYVFKDNVVAGVFAEHFNLFTERSEIGIFGRKYMLDKRRVNFYLHGGASTGRYQPSSWFFMEDLDRQERREAKRPFNTLKFIGGGGVNWRLTDRMSVGHEAILGVTNYKEKIYPSSHFTFSYRFDNNP